MSDNHTSHCEGALLKDIKSSIQRLAEALAEIPGDVRQLKIDVGQLKQDVTVLKAVATDQSKDLRMITLQLRALPNY